MEKFSVKKPFTILVAVIMVLALGIVSMTRMTTDLLPSINFPYLMVITPYPGASPEKVEKAMQGFNPDNIIMHDWWCSLVAARFGRISYLDEAPILYRQHGGNSIGAKAIADPRYIMRRIACGKEIKRTLELTRRQALEFAETYGLGPEDIASRYSAVGSEGKRSRLRFYRSHNIRKHGFVRNCGLILFG